MTAGRVVTFGEVMLRLKSPGLDRLFQSPTLEATFGGAETNVAVSLAQFGVPVAFASAIPANPVGEAGANQRPSRVIYDRAGSPISTATRGDFDWAAILDGETDKYRALALRVLDQFPGLERQVITLRESHSADRNGWSAVLHNRSQ